MALRAAKCDESPISVIVVYSGQGREIGTALELSKPSGSMIWGTDKSRINVSSDSSFGARYHETVHFPKPILCPPRVRQLDGGA